MRTASVSINNKQVSRDLHQCQNMKLAGWTLSFETFDINHSYRKNPFRSQPDF
ncbi:hypothetical protein BCR33DRAFT_715537, partial [Rhizoclosmatium globosum]